MWQRETSKPGAAAWRGQACARGLSDFRAACLPAAGAVERNTTLRGNLPNGRRCFDARDRGAGQRIRALRLPADHGAVAGSWLACRQGSRATDLAARRVESAAETKAAREAVVGRWIVPSAAAGASEPCVELRFRERNDARRKKLADADADRRIHAGVFGDPRGEKTGKVRSDRSAGGRNAVPRNPGEHSLGQRPRVRGRGITEVVGEGGHRYAVHRTGESLGERLL